MSEVSLLKNITYAEPLILTDLVDYQPGRVVSRTLAQNPSLSLTLFAFDQGEGISAHTVPAEALVHVLDGRAAVTVGDKEVPVKAGQAVALPEGVAHSLRAEERFKMLLLVVRRSQAGQV